MRIRFKSDIEDARKLPALAEWATVIGGMISDYGLGNGRIGTDLMPYMIHEGLKRRFPALVICDAGRIWAELTAIKHPLEVELIREIHPCRRSRHGRGDRHHTSRHQRI